MTRVAVGDHVALSWMPSCGACAECLRDLPQLCATAWPAMGTGGLIDGTTRLSRDGEPVYHYSFLSTFAEAASCPSAAASRSRDDVPFDVAALVGCAITTGVGAVWRTAGVRPGDRVAVFGCGGVGLCALLGASPSARTRSSPSTPLAAKLDAARDARRDARASSGPGSAEETAEARARGVGRRRRLRDRGDRPARGDARGVPLDARARRRRADRDPAGGRRAVAPRAAIPRMERRVLGSIYGSSRPERDFPHTLDLYRAGRLPLDRLVSHRLPLDEVEQGFELMQRATPCASCSTSMSA